MVAWRYKFYLLILKILTCERSPTLKDKISISICPWYIDPLLIYNIYNVQVLRTTVEGFTVHIVLLKLWRWMSCLIVFWSRFRMNLSCHCSNIHTFLCLFICLFVHSFICSLIICFLFLLLLFYFLFLYYIYFN